MGFDRLEMMSTRFELRVYVQGCSILGVGNMHRFGGPVVTRVMGAQRRRMRKVVASLRTARKREISATPVQATFTAYVFALLSPALCLLWSRSGVTYQTQFPPPL